MSAGQLEFEEQVYQRNDAQQVSTGNVDMARLFEWGGAKGGWGREGEGEKFQSNFFNE